MESSADDPNPMFSPLPTSALDSELSIQNTESDLDWKPKETTYDRVRTSSTRLFGKKEKFGGGNLLRKRFGRRGRSEHKNQLVHEEFPSPAEVVRRRLSESPDFANGPNDVGQPTSTLSLRTRSSTIDGPKRRQRLPLQRSASLQVGPSSEHTRSSSSVSSFASLIAENSNPNFDEPPDLPRERKKIKARRHSFALPSMASRQSSSSSGSSHLPPDLQWLSHVHTSTSIEEPFEGFAALSKGTSNFLTSTPSRRKRGVCSSPNSSDAEERLHYSGSSYSGSRRSRSRIFSPEDSVQPCRNTEHDNDPMEETSGEESLSSSPDSSMETTDIILTSPGPVPNSAKCILDTMPSVDDLDFMLNELKKSAEKEVFFGSDSLRVVPPPDQWSCARKTKFISWAMDTLGCTKAFAGASLPFLRISKSRGMQLIATLEATKEECKKTIPQEGEKHSIFSSFRSPKPSAIGVSTYVLSGPYSSLFSLLHH